LALVAAIVVPLVAASGWIAWQQYEAQREALGHALLSVSRTLSAAAERELEIGRTLVETLAQSTLIDEGRFAEHHALTVKAVASRPGASVVLFTPAGDQVYNTVRPFGAPLPNVFKLAATLPPAPSEAELPRGGAQYVRRAFETRRPVYSDLFHGQVSGQYLVAVSVPVVRDEEMKYCLTIALPASTFQPLVAAQPRLPGSGAVLFDSRGFIVARAVRPQDFVGKRVPPETLSDIRSAPEAFGRGTNVEGQGFFRALVRSQVSGWGAGVAVNEQAAFGAIWTSMRASAAASAVILLLGTALALWMGRTLARRREAEAQSRAKDHFIAALSHELRNPVAAIALAADLLKRMVREDRQAGEVVDTVSRQVAQLRRLLDDLLDNSRAMYGKLGLEERAVELHACAAQIARDYVRRPAFPAHIDVTGAPVWVGADPARLSQMVDNLLDNAVKYGATTVRIHVAQQSGSGVLTVEDDGQGIAPELLPRLFEPFVQGEQSMARAQGGLGLGLALVKRLAALQHGSIEAHSAGRGKGSRFTLRLPLAEPPAAETQKGPAPKPDKRRVLVVEDNVDARESLRLLLLAEGHEVAVAGDGPDALLKLRSFRPQIAFIDVGLPGMDGYALAREVRSGGDATVVLIALTGYGHEADRRAAFAAGFDLHLTKPLSFSALQEALLSERRSGKA
jgi:signal transduction histidine kinase/CheY-like chemotaxis protein